jgi:hypothetical protein
MDFCDSGVKQHDVKMVVNLGLTLRAKVLERIYAALAQGGLLFSTWPDMLAPHQTIRRGRFPKAAIGQCSWKRKRMRTRVF